ncbi:MAG: glycoside hydrolase family 9 protein [bacterium]|nr:glycoside hydrolase family 9 protein [bacterium]
MLAIEIQSGEFVPNQLVRYTPQPGDELVEEKDRPHREVVDGRVVETLQKRLYRTINGQRVGIGLLSPDGNYLFIEAQSKGELLDETSVDQPEAYEIQSANDPAYRRPQKPVAVYRKGKPNGYSQPLPYLYTISLRLPSPLREGATYTIFLRRLNTAQKSLTYVHRPRAVRSLAVHAIQTGYRPDDPFKRAYYSFWAGVDRDGKHGSCSLTAKTFELVDETGKTVFTGSVQLAKREGEREQISVQESEDYSKSPVYRLDFSGFRKPGRYRVFVPGVGVSYPFRIADNVWEQPFKAAMLGILHQRQGISLAPPATRYRRQRPFHPDDGVQFYQLTITVQEGQEDARGQNLQQLAQAGKLERVQAVWGGYQDAGDWDTLSHHLSATYDLLGLYLLNPTAFRRVQLSLPESERGNRLPDILDEALWQMACWRRLQTPDGGVRGGYGYGWWVPTERGITSWMLKSAGVYAVDHVSTLYFAAVAARTARVLQAFDEKTAEQYLQDALRAWRWVEQHANDDDPTYARLKRLDVWPPFLADLKNKRALAAVELLAATRNPAYDTAFQQSSTLLTEDTVYHDPEQVDAAFAYARLPQGVGTPEVKRKLTAQIVRLADHAIEFSKKNAYDLVVGTRLDYPLMAPLRFFSTPAAGGFLFIYAYELTRAPKYLAAAVQGSNYCLGANPDNLSYCTGVGSRYQQFNFIVDAQITGQMPGILTGHIPYGQGNEGNSASRGANSWVQQWLLRFGPRKMLPDWYDWPVYEQYIDFGRYPLHNETCFNQSTVKAACYWFWLHTRSSTAR